MRMDSDDSLTFRNTFLLLRARCLSLLVTDKVTGLLETPAALHTDQRSVVGDMRTDMRDQESAVLVGVVAVAPFASRVDDRTLNVLIGQMKLSTRQYSGSVDGQTSGELTQRRVGALEPEKVLEQPAHLHSWFSGVDATAMGSTTAALSAF
jgi:hypothetical protein